MSAHAWHPIILNVKHIQDMRSGFLPVAGLRRTWYLTTSSSGIKTQGRGGADCVDPTGTHEKTGSHVCRDFPDVGYCMLSQSISLSRVAAQQPVSFCCFFSCLVVVKCRSKHKGKKKIIIAFDTCCEAKQLFVTGRQLLYFTSPSSVLSGFSLSTSPVKEIIFFFKESLTFRRIQTCSLFSFICFSLMCHISQYLKIMTHRTWWRRQDNSHCTPSQGVNHYIIMCLSHAIMLLESDVSPFFKRGSDHLRFPVFTLSRRRLEHGSI